MEGAKGKAAENGDVKYSKKVREQTQIEITVKYKQQVQKLLNGETNGNNSLLVGYTPDIYKQLGMPDLPFVVGSGHVYSIAKTKAEAKADGRLRSGVNYHGLGADFIENILDYVKKPVMVIASKDVSPNATPLRSTHSVVALVDVNKGDKSLIIPVEITAERTVEGERIDVNVISSAYAKNASALVKEAIAQFNSGENSIYYINKEAEKLIGAGVRFPSQLKQIAASDGIINVLGSKVNMSVQNVTQSQQFKRWFGDWQNHPQSASKVVNADGTPKAVYHGTIADFTAFEPTMGALGKGIYFTDSKDFAKGYTYQNGKAIGHIMEAYIDMKNPYYVKYADNYNVDKLKAEGYDGIIHKDNGMYMVFSPEQVKSATDNIGTFSRSSHDIRFSRKDDVSLTEEDAQKWLSWTKSLKKQPLQFFGRRPKRCPASLYFEFLPFTAFKMNMPITKIGSKTRRLNIPTVPKSIFASIISPTNQAAIVHKMDAAYIYIYFLAAFVIALGKAECFCNAQRHRLCLALKYSVFTRPMQQCLLHKYLIMPRTAQIKSTAKFEQCPNSRRLCGLS